MIFSGVFVMKYFLLLILSFSLFAQDIEKKNPQKSTDLMTEMPDLKRDLILGNILKNGLENLHFSKKKINDDLSRKSFKEYIKTLDYGKRFLIYSDIKDLKIYEKSIDDHIVTGRLNLLSDANEKFRKRIKFVHSYVLAKLEQPFKLNAKIDFEVDPEKRTIPKDLKELKSVWDNILLTDVLNNYLDIEEEQEDLKNPKKDKEKDKKKDDPLKEKITKILKPKEIEVEARKRTKKRYSRVFERLLREDHNNELTKFFNSVTKIFDPHTQYMSPRDKKDFDINMSGSLEGIGAVLREDGSYIKVVEIIPGSASWKGKKLKTGDTILKVAQAKGDAVDIVGMRVEEAVELIRGKKGSEVRLTVKHSDGTTETIPIIRDVVVIEESYVKHSVIETEGSKKKYGYITVPQFYRDFSKSIFDKTARNCTDDVRKSLEVLKKQGISGVILDLRNNAGGSLEDAKLMSGLFIKRGPIVQVKNYEGKIDVLEDVDKEVVYDGPLIVMVNKFSASASEILAGALQDYGRALIVGGGTTHGKGTVQTLLDLDRYVRPTVNLNKPLGSIKLTIQKFYRINGGSTQYKGVTPDITLPSPYSYIESGERYQDYSLKWDTVKSLDYEKWKAPLKIDELRKKSELRVSKSKKFTNINKTVEILESRKNDTIVTLDLDSLRKRRKKNKEDSEKFKFDESNESIKISNVSLDSKLLNKDQKERKEEWVDGLKKDPFIEETLSIMNDLSNSSLAKN